MNTCTNFISDFHCAREHGHPGACKSSSGHWWAKYDSGRADKQPFNPLPTDSAPVTDMRDIWV